MALGGPNRVIPAETAIAAGEGPVAVLPKLQSHAAAITANPQLPQNDLENTIDILFNGGIITGCDITIDSGLTFDVAAGSVLIHRKISVSAQTGFVCVDDDVNYVWVGTDGIISVEQTGVRPSDISHALLGTLTAASGVVTIDQTSVGRDIITLPDAVEPRLRQVTYPLIVIGTPSEPIVGDGVIFLPCMDLYTGETFEPDSGIAGPLLITGTAITATSYEYYDYAYAEDYPAEDEPMLSHTMVWYDVDEVFQDANDIWQVAVSYRNASGYLALFVQAYKFGV